MIQLQHVSFKDWNPIGNHIKNQRENVEICQKVLNMELQMMKI